jgi:hypothetical protein
VQVLPVPHQAVEPQQLTPATQDVSYAAATLPTLLLFFPSCLTPSAGPCMAWSSSVCPLFVLGTPLHCYALAATPSATVCVTNSSSADVPWLVQLVVVVMLAAVSRSGLPC